MMFQRSLLPLTFLASLVISAGYSYGSSHLPDIPQEAPTPLHFQGLKKHSEDLYYGRVKDRDLLAIMERVTPKNKPLWEKYFSIQNNLRVVMQVSEHMQKGHLNDGSGHARFVLEKTPLDSNEIWIAYVTADKQPRGIPYHMNEYSNEETVAPTQGSFAANLQMYFTVTSSSQALITTHLGIARSVEAARTENSPKNISLDLHSFAAKVMLTRNPARKLMVNAPLYAMEKIITDGLPQRSVSIGTREQQSLLARRKEATYEDFLKEKSEEINATYTRQVVTRTQRDLEHHQRRLQEMKASGNQEEFEQELQYYKDNPSYYPYFEIEGETLRISQDKLNARKQQMLQEEFERYLHPVIYGLDLRGSNLTREERTKLFLERQAAHPPILSITPKRTEINIYQKDKPQELWLTIPKESRDYNWLFLGPFICAPSCTDIAVNLEMLATAKELVE